MYHLKISIPSFRQVSLSAPSKPLVEVDQGHVHKGHYVYNIEVGFLGEYGQSSMERQERMARFYHLEKRYSSFLTLHNEVIVIFL